MIGTALGNHFRTSWLMLANIIFVGGVEDTAVILRSVGTNVRGSGGKFGVRLSASITRPCTVSSRPRSMALSRLRYTAVVLL